MRNLYVTFAGVAGNKTNKYRDPKGKGPSLGQHKGHKAEAYVALASFSSDEYVPHAFMGKGGGSVLMENSAAATVHRIEQ